jgi:hypothetical protein
LRKDLRSSAEKSAQICGKRFIALNQFKVQVRFPADLRRFFRRFTQINGCLNYANLYQDLNKLPGFVKLSDWREPGSKNRPKTQIKP